MKLSIVIPCYNESQTIESLVNTVLGMPYENKEIIIVDDGSTDGTKEKLNGCLEQRVGTIIYHEYNQGKGAALRSGVEAATGDIIIIQDADMEYNPYEIPKVIQPILDGQADVVYGSRFSGNSSAKFVYVLHLVGNKLLTALSNLFTRMSLTDMETCYKAFKADIIRSIRIEEDRFGVEPELTAKVAKMKCKVVEVSISYSGRSHEEGKKIKWKDGLYAVWCIIKYNLFYSSTGSLFNHTVSACPGKI